MIGQIEVSFEELPLHVELGFEAALINGTSTIRFDDPAEWSVVGIAIDGYRIKSTHEMKSIDLDRASYRWLYDTIVERLESEGRFRDHIVDQITKFLGESGVAIRDPNAEHSTLNRAQQGI